MAELEKFSALYGKIDYPADLICWQYLLKLWNIEAD